MLQLHGHLERGCWTALAFLCLSLASSGTLSATPLCFAAPGDVTTLGVSAKVQVISRLTESPLPRMNRKKSAANTKVKIQVKIKNNKLVLQLVERLGRKSGWGWYSTRACTHTFVLHSMAVEVEQREHCSCSTRGENPALECQSS